MISYKYFGPQSSPLENRTVGDFVSRVIWNEPGHLTDYCTMGVFDGDTLIAGTCYHNWHPKEGVIELSSGSLTKRWLTKPVVRAMFHLPFDILKCQLVVLRVSQENHSMLSIARSFGFDEFVIPRLRGALENEHIFTLTDDKWRNHRYNKKIEQP